MINGDEGSGEKGEINRTKPYPSHGVKHVHISKKVHSTQNRERFHH